MIKDLIHQDGKAVKSSSFALFSDSCMLPGLRVTLFSLIENLDKENIPEFNLFYEGLSSRDIESLKTSLCVLGRPFRLNTYEFAPCIVSGFKTLHGNLMTYGRLFLSRLLPHHSKVTYLDCDLVVTGDLSELDQFDLSGYPLAAVSKGTFRTALEWPVCQSLGYSLDAPYFNAGVLVLNLDCWRTEDLLGECIDFATKHSKSLFTADQTILNFVFYNNFARLPERFNRELYPDSPLVGEISSGVYHFAGSPKPFDPFGRYLHRNWELFNNYEQRIGFQEPFYTTFRDLRRLRRIAWIAKASARQALKQIRQK